MMMVLVSKQHEVTT